MAINVRKAAQVVAFLIKERGGKTDIIDAVKLAYLADRNFMKLYDVPILNDDFYSMEHGPVDSTTYDYIKGGGREREIWERYISRTENDLTLSPRALEDNFNQLSEAELEVLAATRKEFAGVKSFKLVEWIHKNCEEWENPGKTSIHLSYERVFRALGKRNSEELAERINEIRNLEEALAKAQ
jgi:uncharacterized phage-associated protein